MTYSWCSFGGLIYGWLVGGFVIGGHQPTNQKIASKTGHFLTRTYVWLVGPPTNQN